MFGVTLSLAEFALVEQQPSVSSPILMRGPGHGRAHNQALRRAVNRLIAVIPAAIVLIVAVSMQCACSASGVEGKGLRRQGARDTLGRPLS